MANKVLLSIVIAGVFAQLLKILIFKFKHKQKFHINDLIVTGSMPSAHSALVTALAISIFFAEKQQLTPVFLLAAAFAVVVIRDAFGVRRTAGEEGKILDKIIKSSKFKIKTFHYSLGHTPAEVTAGIIIGILASILVYLI